MLNGVVRKADCFWGKKYVDLSHGYSASTETDCRATVPTATGARVRREGVRPQARATLEHGLNILGCFSLCSTGVYIAYWYLPNASLVFTPLCSWLICHFIPELHQADQPFYSHVFVLFRIIFLGYSSFISQNHLLGMGGVRRYRCTTLSLSRREMILLLNLSYDLFDFCGKTREYGNDRFHWVVVVTSN